MRSNRRSKRKEWRNRCRDNMLRGKKEVLDLRVRSTEVKKRMRTRQTTGKER